MSPLSHHLIRAGARDDVRRYARDPVTRHRYSFPVVRELPRECADEPAPRRRP
jgi:hypothetical protein